MVLVPGDGVLRRCYEVHCAECTVWCVPQGATKRDAERDLRRDGWKTRDGLWCCGSCVAIEGSDRG